MKVCVALITLAVLALPATAHAKRCGNGYIADHKTCHKGSLSATHSPASSTTYHGGGSLSGSTTIQKPLPVQHGITIRKAGVRTCEFEECTVIRHLPKGEKVTWQVSTATFIKLDNSNVWIKKSDVKKTK